MNFSKNSFFTLILLFFTLALFCCCDTPIDRYEPKSEDEKEILSVLIEYQNAKNNFDLDQLLSLMHEKGKFSFQCGLMVSKSDLKELLPGYWAEIKSGNSAVIPITH